MTKARVSAIVVAIALLCAACDRQEKHRPGQPGAVGTSGSDATSVGHALNGPLPGFVGRDAHGTRLWKLTRQFYQTRDNAPAWVEDRKPTRQMDELIAAVQEADREGLDPELYNVSMFVARREEAGRGFFMTKGFDASEVSRLDVWLTYLYLSFASDLTSGLENLSHADPNWKIRDKQADLVTLLRTSLDDNRVGPSLQDLLPRHAQYAALRDALTKYRDIAQHGGWKPLPVSLKLKPGQSHAAVPALAQRLSVTGDYTGAVNEQAHRYDADLQEAVKRFQRRHGLEPDATIGPAVIAALNVPVDARISQIALNLERWRWLPRELGDRYILVNIPEYRLEVWDAGKVPLSMRVVVGKKDTPTPIFADDMTYLVFAPYWNVPSDIVQKETLPSVMRDPAFLQRTNMEVLDKSGKVIDPSSVDLDDPAAYRFRQRPGASNSLGLVKFMFPNSYNVYLHDTPADSLFARATRSFSHGCVRLEEPVKLAEYVLADQPDWTSEKIGEAMHAGEERSVKLRQALPVYLGYWTARVAADGILQFRDDLYGIDERQEAMLGRAMEKLRARAAQAVTFFRTTEQSLPAADRNQPVSIASRQR